MDDIKIYKVLSKIKLDIEGSNLEKTGWIPSEDDKKYMPEDSYLVAINDANKANENVIFENVNLHWDSCDCGDGYGCSHGSFVYEIVITNDEVVHEIEMEEDRLYFETSDGYVVIPISASSVWDFYRACELVNIKLEFSEYAKSLIEDSE